MVSTTNETQETAIAHHEEHPDLRLLGVIIFLASESMMFFGLFAAYLIYRSVTTNWPPEGTEVELLLPALNTVILVSSSFVIHKGDEAIKENNVTGMRNWYLATAVMGIIFLGGQVYEYLTLGYGLTTNLFSNCFYLMTGFHGLHVFVGVLWILVVCWQSRREGSFSAQKHIGIETSEIYWHFVDAIWICLFVLLYVLTRV